MICTLESYSSNGIGVGMLIPLAKLGRLDAPNPLFSGVPLTDVAPFPPCVLPCGLDWLYPWDEEADEVMNEGINLAAVDAVEPITEAAPATTSIYQYTYITH